jgi:hypothetical protein
LNFWAIWEAVAGSRWRSAVEAGGGERRGHFLLDALLQGVQGGVGDDLGDAHQGALVGGGFSVGGPGGGGGQGGRKEQGRGAGDGCVSFHG